MTKLIQYVGENTFTGAKIFVDISSQDHISGGYSLEQTSVCWCCPINPKDFHYFINEEPGSGRFEVTQYGEVFVIGEKQGDGKSKHLCGFHAIRKLVYGEIISIDGINVEQYLSKDDVKIMKKEIDVNDYVKQHPNY